MSADITYKSDIDVLVRAARGHGLAHCLVRTLRHLGGWQDSEACTASAVEGMFSEFEGWPAEWWGGMSGIGGLHVVERAFTSAGAPTPVVHRPLGGALEGYDLDLFHLGDFGPVTAATLATSVDPARLREAVQAPPKVIGAEFREAFAGQIRTNNAAGPAGFRAGNMIRQARAIGWTGGTAFTLGGEPFLLLSGPPAPLKRGAPNVDTIRIASVQIETGRVSLSDGISTS
ncbi:MAG: hypothetical protein FD124_1642 [Alphaproteobacteria bacterium]|nr:MAG: hypothetical protein FD124_1642 [Alphaproteobacteria bacterium]